MRQQTLFRPERSNDLLPSAHRASISDATVVERSSSMPLTEALLQSHPNQLTEATQTPFLRRAGAGTLSKTILSQWLSQDRLYAETYISFITSLIARVTLPYAYVSDKTTSLRWRIIQILKGALDNIHQEIEFFSSTAAKYDLQLDMPSKQGADGLFEPVHATQQYMDLFRSFSNDPGLPLLEGLVVLWATEYCYLTAWSYAAEFMKTHPSDGAEDADGGALRHEFIPNWSSNDFKKFIDEIADITNKLAERERASKKLEVYKAVWLHVLDIEKAFWPVVDDMS